MIYMHTLVKIRGEGNRIFRLISREPKPFEMVINCESVHKPHKLIKCRYDNLKEIKAERTPAQITQQKLFQELGQIKRLQINLYHTVQARSDRFFTSHEILAVETVQKALTRNYVERQRAMRQIPKTPRTKPPLTSQTKESND